MNRLQYFVVRQNGEWKISFESKHYGPYPTQAVAIKAAIDAAHAASTNGRPAQVLVQGLDSKFRTEWTYGEDPYPPKG